MSVLRPVSCDAPCTNDVTIEPSRTPRPTWFGFVPPRFGAGAFAPLRIWLSRSSKTTCPDL